MSDDNNSTMNKARASELVYFKGSSHAAGGVLFWIAASFCVGGLFLIFSGYWWLACIPGLISVVLGLAAFFWRRKMLQRTSIDSWIWIVAILGMLMILPTLWETWSTIKWAHSASSEEADALMDRGKVILEACGKYTLKNGGAYPKNLSTLVRQGLLSAHVIGAASPASPTDAEIERSSDFLYFGGDLDGSWTPSGEVIIFLSKKSYEKYGGPGRAIGYANEQSLFSFDRDLPAALSLCNAQRTLHGLMPVVVPK